MLDRFLAQARSDFSEFDYPRRWVPALAIALVLGGSGFWAARSTGRVGKGVLAAMGASVIGTASYLFVAMLANMLRMGPAAHTVAGRAVLRQRTPDVDAGARNPEHRAGAIGGLFGRGLSGSGSQPG